MATINDNCNAEKYTSHIATGVKLMLQGNEKEQICSTSTSHICLRSSFLL